MSCEKYQLVDLIRESKLGGNGKFNPVTFAEYTEKDGERQTVEPYLHNDEDYCSGQSLDYIFELRVNGHSPLKKVQVNATQVEKFKIFDSKH